MCGGALSLLPLASTESESLLTVAALGCGDLVLVYEQSHRADPEWLRDFEAAARRPLRLRIDYSFIRTPQPVIDDEPYRVFDTMEDYRRWCARELPKYLGYA